MEYFVRQIGEFSGSAILILALLIGLSIGWFLRGQININSALNEQVSRWTEFSLLSLKSDLIRVLRFQVITEKPHKDAKGSAVFKPSLCVWLCERAAPGLWRKSSQFSFFPVHPGSCISAMEFKGRKWIFFSFSSFFLGPAHRFLLQTKKCLLVILFPPGWGGPHRTIDHFNIIQHGSEA